MKETMCLHGIEKLCEVGSLVLVFSWHSKKTIEYHSTMFIPTNFSNFLFKTSFLCSVFVSIWNNGDWNSNLLLSGSFLSMFAPGFCVIWTAGSHTYQMHQLTLKLKLHDIHRLYSFTQSFTTTYAVKCRLCKSEEGGGTPKQLIWNYPNAIMRSTCY